MAITTHQPRTTVRFEHMAINVPDPHATAAWYTQNLGLMALSPPQDDDAVFISDADKNFAIALRPAVNHALKLRDLNLHAAHFAYEGHNVEAIAEKMISAGAQHIGATTKNAVGDIVIDIEDPFGLKHQLLSRVNPYFPKAKQSGLRFEHYGLNVPNQKDFALWYIECLGLEVSWSKDAKGPNNSSTYRVPFIGDRSQNMSFELYAKGEAANASYGDLDPSESHFCFATKDPTAVAAKMVAGGATQLNETSSAAGDHLIDLHDPWGFHLQLVDRQRPLLD